MAALPDDDGPTMTGAPGDRRVDHGLLPIEPSEGDDTTTAEAGPPASRHEHPDETGRIGAPHRHAHEGRTVQQTLDPPLAAGKPSRLAQQHGATASAAAPRPPSSPPEQGPAAGGASYSSSSPVPSTPPGGAVARGPAVAPIRQTTESDIDSTDITDDLADDGEPLEDSITATAPRINHANLIQAAQSGRGVPLIPGSVEIRSAEHDELLDETEVRTRPGNSRLQGPATLRGSPAPLQHGAAPPPPRPAAGRPPSSPDIETDDDGVTAESLAPAMASARAVAGAPPTTQRGAAALPSTRHATQEVSSSPGAPSRRPAAGAPFRADSVGEPPTQPGLEGVDGVAEPATRPGLGESPTRPGAPDPETQKRLEVKLADPSSTYANEDDDEESITTRGPVGDAYEENEESVTTQAPAVPPSIIEAAIKAPNGVADATLDDGTDGTTQRVKKKTREAALSSPADSEAESITTQAPGPLTNILRVIASGSSPSLVSEPRVPVLDQEEPPENRTAVMVNAPLKRALADVASSSSLPAIRPTGGPLLHGPRGSAVPRLEPSSESGLRVARDVGVDRASLGALGLAGDASARSSGVGRSANAVASDGSISVGSADRDRAHVSGEEAVFPGQLQPIVEDVDLGSGPRYGLLVAIVAVISICVPVTLFLVLHHPTETLVPGVPAEPASEIETRDGTRVKAVRGKNGQLTAPSASVAPPPPPSAAPSAAASSKPGAKGFPFRR